MYKIVNLERCLWSKQLGNGLNVRVLHPGITNIWNLITLEHHKSLHYNYVYNRLLNMLVGFYSFHFTMIQLNFKNRTCSEQCLAAAEGPRPSSSNQSASSKELASRRVWCLPKLQLWFDSPTFSTSFVLPLHND